MVSVAPAGGGCGPLGLMTTDGGTWLPGRPGVDCAFTAPVCAALGAAGGPEPAGGGAPEFSLPVPLASLTLVDEEVGVGAFEPEGDRESPCPVEEERGDAVPVDEGSFFLDDLLESFALESCSCWSSINMHFFIRSRTTYHSCPKAFHLARILA